jgi:hypothetical protein
VTSGPAICNRKEGGFGRFFAASWFRPCSYFFYAALCGAKNKGSDSRIKKRPPVTCMTACAQHMPHAQRFKNCRAKRRQFQYIRRGAAAASLSTIGNKPRVLFKAKLAWV